MTFAVKHTMYRYYTFDSKAIKKKIKSPIKSLLEALKKALDLEVYNTFLSFSKSVNAH